MVSSSLAYALRDLHPSEFYSPPPPASFSGVLSEENSLTAREDTEVISGAIFDHLVYLMHA